VRRGLVTCAVAVTIFAAIIALRWNRIATVSATSVSANLTGPFGLIFFGCPLGPTPTFCDQAPGTSSSPQLIGVLNTTAVTNVTVSLAAIPGLSANFAAGDFTITNNTCTGSLSAKQGCAITLAFSPTTNGLRQAALVVTDAQGDTLTINIEGRGTNLAVTPPPPACGGPIGTAFPFCETNVGSASSAATFTVSAGTVATGINVTLAAIPGLSSEFASGDFTITGTTCTGALNALASCNVTVEFTPTVAGLRSAILTATDSNNDSSSVYVSGSTPSGLQFGAASASGPIPCHVVDRDFCNEPQGGTTVSYSFPLTNTSGTQITGLTITPPIPTTPPTQPPTDFTVQGTTCTATLAANASCTISVAFTPQSTGLRQGEIEATDAQGDVAGLNLAGVGDDYQLSLASGQMEEITVAQGTGTTYKAQLTTDSVFGMNGEQVTFACPTNLPVFSTCAITPCPATVTPNSTTAFSITIVTTSATKTAPPVTGPCTESASIPPAIRGPGMEMRPAPQPASRRWLFPSLALLAMALALAAFGAGARNGKRVRWILAAAGVAAIIFVGCHHGAAPTNVTPVAVTNMTIVGNALDANGNAINASRPMTITLDVIAGK
jgi:hypothetical protein